MRYVWTGESLPAGTLPPFRLRLHLPLDQSLLARGELIAYARCVTPCRLSVWARVKDPAGPSRFLRGHRRLPLASNRRTRLVLRLPAAPRSLLDRALRAGRPGRVHVRFHASAGSGENVTVERVLPVTSGTPRLRRSSSELRARRNALCGCRHDA